MANRSFGIALVALGLAGGGAALARDTPPPANETPTPTAEQPKDLVGLARSFVQRVGGQLEKADERELFALAPPRVDVPPGPGEGDTRR